MKEIAGNLLQNLEKSWIFVTLAKFSLALVHKHVKMDTSKWILETGPRKHVQIPENEIFLGYIHSADCFPIKFLFKSQALQLIFPDIST